VDRIHVPPDERGELEELFRSIGIAPEDAGVRGLQLTSAGSALLERCELSLQGFNLLFGRMPREHRVSLVGALNAAEAALRPPPRWSF
jgi:hypothetical protein